MMTTTTRRAILALVASLAVAPLACTSPSPSPQPASPGAEVRAEPEPEPEPTPVPQPEPTLEPLCLLEPGSSFDQAEASADTTSLAEAFAATQEVLPPGGALLAGRIIDGADGPAVQWYSLGDTGFASSDGRFWPASTVKLMAALSALMTLAEHGANSEAVVAFDDVYGGYEGPVSELIELAIVPSDNPAYNRLMLIAGLDAFHARHFPPEAGFPHLVMQRFYVKPVREASLRTSPAIRWRMPDGRSGTIAERVATFDGTRCPKEGNCTSLFELLEVLRRLVLDEELPQAERFGMIEPADRARLRQWVRKAPSKFEAGVAEALGHREFDIYNKAGKVRSDDHLDHALVVDRRSGARWLLAASVPFTEPKEDEAITLGQLATLARVTLGALSEPAGLGMGPAPVQRAAGSMPELVVTTAGAGLRVALASPAGDVAVDLWLDGTWQGVLQHGSEALETAAGRLLVARARLGDSVVGHRAWRPGACP